MYSNHCFLDESKSYFFRVECHAMQITNMFDFEAFLIWYWKNTIYNKNMHVLKYLFPITAWLLPWYAMDTIMTTYPYFLITYKRVRQVLWLSNHVLNQIIFRCTSKLEEFVLFFHLEIMYLKENILLECILKFFIHSFSLLAFFHCEYKFLPYINRLFII